MTGTRAAPLGRLLRSELSCLLRRPRNLVILGVLALLPVAIGVGVASAGAPSGTRGGPGPGLIAAVTANGLMLPIVSLAIALTLLLPLAVCVAAADALAGEASSGTLRALLLAPVGRLRVVVVKALGVLTLAIAGVLVIAAVGWLTGTLVVGDGGRLLTLSGTAIDAGDVWGRVWLAAGWTILQLAAVGAIALAVSALTDRPLVVIATVLGGAIVFGVLLAIPSLGWLHPLLLTSAWPALADLLRDPIPTENLTHGAFVAGYYLILGLAVAVTGTLRREV